MTRTGCYFCKTLGEACGKTDWQIHAWCMMSNHFHLVTFTRGAFSTCGHQKANAYQFINYQSHARPQGEATEKARAFCSTATFCRFWALENPGA
jgi:REP element-mobilizing transposase RayT